MKITIEISEAQLEELAAKIAAKVSGGAPPAEEDVDLGLGDELEPVLVTLKDVMDKIRGMKKEQKPAVLAVFKKFKITKATELPEDKCAEMMEALNKIK